MTTCSSEAEEKRGLGKVVYSVDSEDVLEERQSEDSAQVTRASKESFPASDPPDFSGSTTAPDPVDATDAGPER